MRPSGYTNKFLFEFTSRNGSQMAIAILQRGYSGSVKKRALGAAPVLKKESGSNNVYGTSLEIMAECLVGGEYVELYTSDPKEYYVTLTVGGTVVWSGFVTPELYSEPNIAPPYDVQIIATDGLGELKLSDYAATGRQSLLAHLKTLLAHTGFAIANTDITIVNSLHPSTTSSAINFLSQVELDMDHFAADGKTNYDVLESILETFHLSITQYANKWLLIRETDVEISSGRISGRDGAGNAVSFDVESLGSMANRRWWPEGQLSTEIVPAKNSVTVNAALMLRESLFANPKFEDGSTGWTYTSGVLWHSSTLGVDKPGIPYNNSISQSIHVIVAESYKLVLSLAALKKVSSERDKGIAIYIRVETQDGRLWNLIQNDKGESLWTVALMAPCGVALAAKGGNGQSKLTETDFEECVLEIPPVPATGTLSVRVSNTTDDNIIVSCGGVYLTLPCSNGVKTMVTLNNNARGSADDVNLGFTDLPQAHSLGMIYNIITIGGAAANSWVTGHITSATLFSTLMAIDYAYPVAIPRQKEKGKLNVPLNANVPFALVDSSNLVYLPREWDWNLYADSIDVEMLSLPASVISILGTQIKVLTDREAQESGGTGSTDKGSSGGSGGSTNPICAWLKYDETNHAVYLEDRVVDGKHLSFYVFGELTAGEPAGDTPTPETAFTSIAYAGLASLTAEEMDKIPTAWAAKQLLTRIDTLEHKDSALYLLSDTYHNTQTILRADGTAKQNGDGLVYNAALGKWVAGVIQAGGDVNDVKVNGVSVVDSDKVANISLTWSNVQNKPSWIGSSKPSYFYGDGYLTGFGSLAAKSSLSASDIPTLAISKISGLQSALDGKVPTSRTVNGHALTSNVTVTRGDIGLGNVENKSSATIRGEITSANVTNALGYTPVNKAGDTMTGDLVANTASINLGTSAKPWGRIYANRWYPNANDTTNYIEYTNGGFLIHGNIAATGEVAAGE